MVTKAEFLFMIQSVNLLSSAHTHCSQPSVHTATNCSHLQPSTLQLFYPVHIQCTHTAANLQCTLQPTAAIYNHLRCSYSIQCTSSAHTLQLYYPVHTAATLSGANTIQCIQCTSGPPQGKPIPLLAYLQSSQQTLMVDCSSP